MLQPEEPCAAAHRLANPFLLGEKQVARVPRRRERGMKGLPGDVRLPDNLVAARLRHIVGTHWGLKRYMDMTRHRDLPPPATGATPQTA
ncbi:MAG TPA: hypothetical protein VKC51_12345 [Lacunisphaera sp.]|nr:hypothetical protein [Lacunisphaera sp.]